MKSAKNYQPFRYPGGKSKLAANPAFQALLFPLVQASPVFYEGFVGSGAVTIAVALQFPDKQIVVADKDFTISGFWELIAGGTDDEITEVEALITAFPSLEDKVGYFKHLRVTPPTTLVERAFHALFFNRTTFSGIAMSQPIGGFNQTSKWSIDCRYNAPKLVEKIRNLRTLFHGRLIAINTDCLDWLPTVPAGVPLFLDPPYFVKGSVLYPERMDAFQHGKLAETLVGRTNWIMSYDICPEIQQLYDFAQTLEVGFRYSINGKKENWKHANEYLIVSPEIDTRPFERLCFPMEEANEANV